jgi:glutaredoxin
MNKEQDDFERMVRVTCPWCQAAKDLYFGYHKAPVLEFWIGTGDTEYVHHSISGAFSTVKCDASAMRKLFSKRSDTMNRNTK